MIGTFLFEGDCDACCKILHWHRHVCAEIPHLYVALYSLLCLEELRLMGFLVVFRAQIRLKKCIKYTTISLLCG